MVSILIISHSEKIALGTKELAEQMKQSELDILAVGGTSDGNLGTDTEEIEAALKQIDKSEGVIVLADLGSAVMSFEMIHESLEPDIQAKIRLANAPLVEGAILATVESSLGKNMTEILATIEKKSIIEKNNL
jgi:dihydroxyacetone kinase phosphotransfer subunit